MAVFRKLQISYWQDDFVNELTPEEKYFYIYLMTNSMTTQCGIYKLNKWLAEYETGYARDTIEKLLNRFVECGKVLVSEATKEIMIVNWIRYNFINSRNTITCINSELKSVKETSFIEKFYIVCRKNDYPVKLIFKGMDLPFAEAACKELQGACKKSGEEKEEVKEKAEAGVRAYIRERREYKEKLRKGSDNNRINAAAYRYIDD